MIQPLAILLSVCLLTGCSPAANNVVSQNDVIMDIKDFGAKGDGKTNDHEAFIKAAAFFNSRKGNGKLVISKGTYIVGRQKNNGIGWANRGENVLGFKGLKNFTIAGTGNPTLKMRNGLKIGAFDSNSGKAFVSQAPVFGDLNYLSQPGHIISMDDCSNITIQGFNIDGNNRTMILGGKFGDRGFQVGADGIFINNCEQLKVVDMNITYCGRDGILVLNETPNKETTRDQKISLLRSTFNYNARQGLSWGGGVGLQAQDCDFSHTGKGKFNSAPAAGVDIEAEVGIITKGKFINCTFTDNLGCAMVADSGPSSDCQFEDCTFWGTDTWSVWVDKPKFKFTNCKIYGSEVVAFDAAREEDKTIFLNCQFEDKPYQGKPAFGTFLTEINFRRRVLFDGCTFTTRTKKLLWNEGKWNWKEEEMPLYKNCTFNIYNIPFKEPDWFMKAHKVKFENAVYNFYVKPANKQKYSAAYGVNVFLTPDKVNWIIKND